MASQRADSLVWNFLFKVTERSFQEPIPNSPLRLSLFILWRPFFARVKINHRRVYSRILAKA